MRRSRKDIELGRRLRIGQSWRDRADGRVWTIRQIHRGDCHADLLCQDDGARDIVTFADLRDHFDQLIPADQEAVVA